MFARPRLDAKSTKNIHDDPHGRLRRSARVKGVEDRGGSRVNGGIGSRDGRLKGVGIGEEGVKVSDGEDEFLAVSARTAGGRAHYVLSAGKSLRTKGEKSSLLPIFEDRRKRKSLSNG
ncbi:hypothetical protein Sjap_013160 [Stephania japonica]|uniref:Uncharacterized protein n=1 Tax=Stephania japonica TaxID=461633 RepID=A0AAP0IZ67_9MAGN